MPIGWAESATEPTGHNVPDARFFMKVRIETDTRINQPRFTVRFDGAIWFATAVMPGSGPLQNYRSVTHATTFEFSCDAPPLTPDNALYVFVFSENPVRVEEVRQT
jgi:hypothetical protein